MNQESKRLEGRVVVKSVPWITHKQVLDSIRTSVFVNEQGVAAEIVTDGTDKDCFHFLLEDDGYPIGCGRLQASGKIERMAVLLGHRNRGLGAGLLDFIIEFAREKQLESLYLHAQLAARSYYERAGFAIEGEVFSEAGIDHVAMRMEISTATDSFISGVTYPHPFAELSLKIAGNARRSLRIYSPKLDHEIFDNDEWSAAISGLIRRGREAKVKILICNANAIVSRGHRLLNIARRLSSSVTIQRLDQHPEVTDECYVLRDLDGIVYKPDEPGRPGFYEPDSRASCLHFIEKFDLLWEQSVADPELRQLSL